MTANNGGSFGSQVRQRREALGLTRKELAHRVGCSIETIRKIESGQRHSSVQIAELLAKHLGIAADNQFAFIESARAKSPMGNLPAALTRFIGRERELAEVAHAVGAKRLVTLMGAAGMGKTRLAIEVARQMTDFSEKSVIFKDGVWLVELAPLADSALVPTAVASAFNLPERPGRLPIDAAAAFLARKQMLLILDNCEHLIEACARLAETLLRACPHLHILVTSREALRIPGEAAWRVPPLSMPDSASTPSLERVAEYDAVQLFVEHASSAQAGFTLTPNNLTTVVQICRRLDGMPLAIEMAAAQVADLGLADVAAGLDDRFALLASGSRTALPHHQTLRATLDWSYNLLTEPERVLLARLSAFAGGWTAEAAREVCADKVLLLDSVILGLLLQLVRKSLVVTLTSQPEGQTRYRLLESVRQYADEKLGERGEIEITRDHHLTYFLGMAEETMDVGGPRVEASMRRLEPEYDNLRTAFAWASARDDQGEAALRSVSALRPFWFCRGHRVEGMAWVDKALAQGSTATVSARARALLAKAMLCLFQGDMAHALNLGEDSLALFRETDDRLGMAWCLELLANNLFSAGAQALAEEALSLFREFGSLDGEGRALRALGTAAYRSGDRARSAKFLEQAIAVARWGVMSCLGYLYDVNPKRALELCTQELSRLIEAGNAELVAPVMAVHGALLMAEGEYERARQMLEESLRWWQRIGASHDLRSDLHSTSLPEEFTELSLAIWVFDANYFNYTLLSLGFAELSLGCIDRAHGWLEQTRKFAREAGMALVDIAAQLLMASVMIAQSDFASAASESLACLQRFHQFGYRSGVVCSLVQVADLARHQGNLRRASRLLGAAEAFADEVNVLPLWLNRIPSLWYRRAQETVIAPALAAARAELGDAEFEAVYVEGQHMSLDQAVECALSGID
jgi:predicted ATPase/DNA-binding XRE family transcriptional regulator